MQVGLREANQQFGKIVKRIRKGEEIILTDRGKPFAKISPISRNGAEEEDDWEAIFDQMAAEGRLIRAKVRGPVRLSRPVKIRGKSIVETLREMRDEED